MDINQTIANELGIKLGQVEATVKLIDEGNTIPFIARYRKEVTGALNDEVLRRQLSCHHSFQKFFLFGRIRLLIGFKQ